MRDDDDNMSANSSYSNPSNGGMGSGRSTPRNNASTPPPPSSEGPSPLMVGTRFVKQYYKVLVGDNPKQIVKFYQPSVSLLSTGSGSQPSSVATTTSAMDVSTRFPVKNVRFEFEHGAIDAQASSNNSILLVVTGQVLYNQDEQEDERLSCKTFVHTFFLNAITTSQGKKSYYVHNDILRFLSDTMIPTNNSNNSEVTAAAVEEETVIVSNQTTKTAATTIDEKVEEIGPGGGVEETKETVLDDANEPQVEETKTTEKKVVPEPSAVKTKGKSKKPETAASKKETEQPKEDEGKAAAGPKSSSWASMVARVPAPSTAATTTTSTGPSTPVRPAAKTKTTEQPPAASPVRSPITNKAEAAPALATSAPTQSHNKRDPDCTLVIKNIDVQTKESEILAMLEPFVKRTESAIVGSTVSVNKNIAFVDFNSSAPVLRAVEKHKAEAFVLHGKVLDIYQKTLEQRNRQRGGGGNRSGGAGSGGGGGGRQQKGGGGRSDRGGGSGGRSGRAGR